MTEFGPDLDLDTDLGTDVDLPEDTAVAEVPVVVDGSLDLGQPPDPLLTADVAPVGFGQTAEFPDGTLVDNPRIDHLGYQYATEQNWVNGEFKHVPAHDS